MLKKEKQLINTLSEFGLNKYEAQAYISLLQNSSVTAYEISKNSPVPQSKIYESMKSLVNRGLAVAEGSNPVKYTALPVDEFLQRYRSSMEESIQFVRDNLQNIVENPQLDYMWHFQGRNEVIAKTKNIIRSAEQKLSLELWQGELKVLASSLKQAERRGVNIVLVLYGAGECDIGTVYYHEMEGMEEERESSGKWLTVIKDEEESLFGIFRQQNSFGVWTRNRSFMILARSFISHDIFIAEIYKKYRGLLNDEFGPNLRRLREELDKYL